MAPKLLSTGSTYFDPSLPILQQAKAKDNFNCRRDLAVSNPERARDRLVGYARLNIKIVRARDLLAVDFTGKSDPYVEVFLNDEFCIKSHYLRNTINPAWNWETEIPIIRPGGVILLRVMDHELVSSPDMLGFVEFRVAELPLGECVSGWFVLSPQRSLVGTAQQRLDKRSVQPCAEVCGAVFLELTLNVVSGDPSDEFYAWHLPQPKFKVYPEIGFQRRLHAQAICDKVMSIKSSVFDGIVQPVLGCFAYVVHWREKAFSLLVLATVMGSFIYPRYLITGCLGLQGVFLLLLANRDRRLAMVAHPSTLPLSEEGYRLVALMCDTDCTKVFLTRVVSSMNGKVVHASRFREFAAFATHLTSTVTTYVDLKRQLRAVASTEDDPFVTFAQTPLQTGTLVTYFGVNGEVLTCLNPEDPLEWTYTVRFSNSADDYHTVRGDELETRLDMRWMSNNVVLAVIPNSLETHVERLQPVLESIDKQIERFTRTLRKIVCWESPAVSSTLAALCIAVSLLLLFSWFNFFLYTCLQVIPYLLVIAVLFIFTMHTRCVRSCRRSRLARSQLRRYSSKVAQNWKFVQSGTLESSPAPTTPTEKRMGNSGNSCFSFLSHQTSSGSGPKQPKKRDIEAAVRGASGVA